MSSGGLSPANGASRPLQCSRKPACCSSRAETLTASRRPGQCSRHASAVRSASRVAQHPFDRGVAVGEAGVAVDLPDPVVAVLDDAAEAFLALAQRRLDAQPFAALARGLERAPDYRRQPAQVLLQHEIRRAAADRLDRDFLADRAGHVDERQQRIVRLHDRQRLVIAEAGHRVIGQHHVRGERGQRFAQLLGRAHPAVLAWIGKVADGPGDRFGVLGGFLDQQGAKRGVHSGPPPATAAAGALRGGRAPGGRGQVGGARLRAWRGLHGGRLRHPCRIARAMCPKCRPSVRGMCRNVNRAPMTGSAAPVQCCALSRFQPRWRMSR